MTARKKKTKLIKIVTSMPSLNRTEARTMNMAREHWGANYPTQFTL